MGNRNTETQSEMRDWTVDHPKGDQVHDGDDAAHLPHPTRPVQPGGQDRRGELPHAAGQGAGSAHRRPDGGTARKPQVEVRRYTIWQYYQGKLTHYYTGSPMCSETDWVGLTWIMIVLLSAPFCLGSLLHSRNLAEMAGYAAGRDGGKSKSKSTQPRSTNRWGILYFFGC